MTSATSALKVLVAEGLAEPLSPLGYVSNPSRRKWVRETDQLLHLVFLEKMHGLYYLQWGIVCPELVEIIWGMPYQTFDIGHAIVTGTPKTIRFPSRSGRFSDLDLATAPADLSQRVREDVEVVTAWLEPLASRKALRDYLLLNRERSDPRLLIPASLGLKLIVAAGLALLDGDLAGCELLAEAQTVSEPLNETSRTRIAGLHLLAADIC